jgi:CRP-like cAMP-binding protein
VCSVLLSLCASLPVWGTVVCMKIRLQSRTIDMLWESTFVDLPRREISKLVALSSQVDRPAGCELLTQGEPGSEVFVLLSGSVTVLRDGAVVAGASPGAALGELATGSTPGAPGCRTASVVAVNDVSVAVFSPREWWAALEQCPRFATAVLNESARRVDATVDS